MLYGQEFTKYLLLYVYWKSTSSMFLYKCNILQLQLINWIKVLKKESWAYNELLGVFFHLFLLVEV